MKRIISALLILVFALCTLTACGGESIVGVWEGEEDGHRGVLTFNKDGTGSVAIDGVSVDTKWTVAEEKYLTVTTELSGTAHKFFDGAEFSVEDGKLTVKSNGTAAVFTRKK